MPTHVVIIGAYGSAGVAAAESLAERGDVELTLIDDGDPGGGLCILRGCMPSKEVLSAAEHRYQARHDDRIEGTTSVDLERVVETKDEHVSNFAAHRRAAVAELAGRENVEFVHDTARFVDDHTVMVSGRTITADYVVIATGSTVNVPDLDGIDDVPFVTSADVLDATEFGESGIVMGFGYVGIELVPYLSEAAGMDVTVIEHDERPLDEADPEFGDELLAIYREEFDIEILTETRERSVESTEDGVRMTVETEDGEETIEADQLFVFTGRKPDLDSLALAETALDPGEGWVRDTMQAAADDHVYVVGDANGKEPILHVAKEQGFHAAENIAADIDGEALSEYSFVPHHVMFSAAAVYPFVRIGLTEEEADTAGRDCVAVTREAIRDGVFRTKAAPRGLAKLVVDADDGTVLGYQGLHYHADVMAKTMQVAIERGMDVREIPNRAYHPTTPEILDGLFRDAAEEL